METWRPEFNDNLICHLLEDKWVRQQTFDEHYGGKMSEYTKHELEEAMTALASTLHKCEKIQEGGKLRSSQKTLNDRRVKALRIALVLIKREMGCYDAD